MACVIFAQYMKATPLLNTELYTPNKFPLTHTTKNLTRTHIIYTLGSEERLVTKFLYL